MSTTTPDNDHDASHPQVLTVDEVAHLRRISRDLAFAACRAGTLPHLRVGKRILIPRHAIDSMLRNVRAPEAS